MIEQEIDWGRNLIRASKTIATREAEEGHHPPPEERLSILEEAGEEAASWQNSRIPDRSLRHKVEDYLRTAREVRELLAHGPLPDPGEPPYSELLAGLRRLERLDLEVMKRMDELNWPEVDD
jgi:hypothetical protein